MQLYVPLAVAVVCLWLPGIICPPVKKDIKAEEAKEEEMVNRGHEKG
jgi:hypothetical protein